MSEYFWIAIGVGIVAIVAVVYFVNSRRTGFVRPPSKTHKDVEGRMGNIVRDKGEAQKPNFIGAAGPVTTIRGFETVNTLKEGEDGEKFEEEEVLVTQQRRPLGMVALQEDDLPSHDEVRAKLEELYPEVAEMVEGVEVSASDANRVVWTIAGDEFAVTRISRPIPWNDIMEQCRNAWWWPDAIKAMRPHQSHIMLSMVTETKQDNVNQQVGILTTLAATIAQCAPTAGFYWPEARMVQPPERLIEGVRGLLDDDPPADLWVSAFPFKDDEGTGMITHGLSLFVDRELEIEPSDHTEKMLIDKTHDTIRYLLEKGPVLGHGSTLGVNREERMRVTHQQSDYFKGVDVMHLRFENFV
ncbi:MAG: hypothetical protein Alpg2KO_31990 [Alphaproteobacteria bacterium]